MTEILGNLDELSREVAASDFDAIVAMSPENVPYTSGVLLWTQRTIRDRLALVVWPQGRGSQRSSWPPTKRATSARSPG